MWLHSERHTGGAFLARCTRFLSLSYVADLDLLATAFFFIFLPACLSLGLNVLSLRLPIFIYPEKIERVKDQRKQ